MQRRPDARAALLLAHRRIQLPDDGLEPRQQPHGALLGADVQLHRRDQLLLVGLAREALAHLPRPAGHAMRRRQRRRRRVQLLRPLPGRARSGRAVGAVPDRLLPGAQHERQHVQVRRGARQPDDLQGARDERRAHLRRLQGRQLLLGVPDAVRRVRDKRDVDDQDDDALEFDEADDGHDQDDRDDAHV